MKCSTTFRASYFWTVLAIAMLGISMTSAQAQDLPIVGTAETQPLRVHTNRLIEAMNYLGTPLPKDIQQKLKTILESEDSSATQRVQKLLDRYCLLGVTINPESRVKVDIGPAARTLAQHGWTQFLVKVNNEAGVTARLRVQCPQALPVHDSRIPGVIPPPSATPKEARDRWLDMKMFDGRPLVPQLSGLPLEYRIIQIYSRDSGKRAAVVSFDVGSGTQDIGFRNDVTVTFNCAAATPITLKVHDEHGKPTTASFEIRDPLGRVYPSQAKRLAPDFSFHPQIYRADGEKLFLPAGNYTIDSARGPEYLKQKMDITVGDKPMELTFDLKRWIDPSLTGWWSGDHHIHAAGCKHYNNPSQGVHAEDMMRHIRGEDLKIGANLTWGPCFDYQKQFFTGKIDAVSQYPYLLRYDIEVSGFGSHRTGHLVLLRLKEQMYPGGDSSDHWPTLGLNTLRWAKRQGAVVGPAHSGWGLEHKLPGLPSYEVPPFDGIGANEYIMQVTHKVPGPTGKLIPAVDFISTVDTVAQWELNIWYHTLNVGFRTRISGETDFPCIYGERVGLGRSYVNLDGKLNYDDWCEGIRQGRAYVSDGYSHLMDFQVGNRLMGTSGSELKLDQPGNVHVTASVAAMLDEELNEKWSKLKNVRDRRAGRPFWHVEKARIGETRRVPVELLINGEVMAKKEIQADGETRDISFDIPIKRSSWVAMRIYPSSHTNPVFVVIDNKPIRVSKRSAQWCLKSLNRCWEQKEKFYDADEIDQARKDYAHARQTYRRLIDESDSR